MEDLFWDIFFLIAIIVFAFCAIFLIFLTVIGIIDICNNVKLKKICNTDKPKKKYYLIKYDSSYKYEIIIKAQSPIEARLKFQRKYKEYDFVSIKEIKDE